jgi:uncharacterized protein (DUF433 family)
MNLIIDEKEFKFLPITIDPDIVSGVPVFKGTRVPVEALLTNLEAGLSLDEFIENFPTVTRQQAIQVLEFSKSTLLRLAKSAKSSRYSYGSGHGVGRHKERRIAPASGSRVRCVRDGRSAAALPAESFRSNTRDHRPSDQSGPHRGQSAAGD